MRSFINWVYIRMQYSWTVALVVSLFLVILLFLQLYIFDISLPLFKRLSIFFSVSIIIFFFIRKLVDVFIYNKIKLIYKNIHDFKSKPGDLKNVDLQQVDVDVRAWNVNREKEIEKLMVRESYRRQFVGNVAHELKTPIFNIQGYIESLLDGALEDPDINKKFLKRAMKSVNRMIHIVEDLDQITKLEGGKIEIEDEPVDITEVILDVVEQLEMKAKERNTKVIVEQDKTGRFMVQVDVEKIKQVLINLIVNAIKYGKDEGEVLIRTFDMDENILVEVADNGNGISQHHLNKIFDRFYRVDSSRDRDKGGSGLGLSIVKHIIEAHNQVVNIRSTEGTGSTFSFTLQKA